MLPVRAPSKRPAPAGPIEAEKLSPYLWGLFFMLTSATLFDGFDTAIVVSVAPQLQKEYGLTLAEWGRVNALIQFGVVPSFFLVMLADKFGRRAIITLTMAPGRNYRLPHGNSAPTSSVAHAPCSEWMRFGRSTSNCAA